MTFVNILIRSLDYLSSASYDDIQDQRPPLPPQPLDGVIFSILASTSGFFIAAVPRATTKFLRWTKESFDIVRKKSPFFELTQHVRLYGKAITDEAFADMIDKSVCLRSLSLRRTTIKEKTIREHVLTPRILANLETIFFLDHNYSDFSCHKFYTDVLRLAIPDPKKKHQLCLDALVFSVADTIDDVLSNKDNLDKQVVEEHALEYHKAGLAEVIFQHLDGPTPQEDLKSFGALLMCQLHLIKNLPDTPVRTDLLRRASMRMCEFFDFDNYHLLVNLSWVLHEYFDADFFIAEDFSRDLQRVALLTLSNLFVDIGRRPSLLSLKYVRMSATNLFLCFQNILRQCKNRAGSDDVRLELLDLIFTPQLQQHSNSPGGTGGTGAGPIKRSFIDVCAQMLDTLYFDTRVSQEDTLNRVFRAEGTDELEDTPEIRFRFVICRDVIALLDNIIETSTLSDEGVLSREQKANAIALEKKVLRIGKLCWEAMGGESIPQHAILNWCIIPHLLRLARPSIFDTFNDEEKQPSNSLRSFSRFHRFMQFGREDAQLLTPEDAITCLFLCSAKTLEQAVDTRGWEADKIQFCVAVLVDIIEEIEREENETKNRDSRRRPWTEISKVAELPNIQRIIRAALAEESKILAFAYKHTLPELRQLLFGAKLCKTKLIDLLERLVDEHENGRKAVVEDAKREQEGSDKDSSSTDSDDANLSARKFEMSQKLALIVEFVRKIDCEGEKE